MLKLNFNMTCPGGHIWIRMWTPWTNSGVLIDGKIPAKFQLILFSSFGEQVVNMKWYKKRVWPSCQGQTKVKFQNVAKHETSPWRTVWCGVFNRYLTRYLHSNWHSEGVTFGCTNLAWHYRCVRFLKADSVNLFFIITNHGCSSEMSMETDPRCYHCVTPSWMNVNYRAVMISWH